MSHFAGSFASAVLRLVFCRCCTSAFRRTVVASAYPRRRGHASRSGPARFRRHERRRTRPRRQRLARAHDRVDILITGVGMVATSVWCTRAMSADWLDLAFNFGVCGSFVPAFPLSAVVHVTSDMFPELGAQDGVGFCRCRTSGFFDPDQFPFSGGHLSECRSAATALAGGTAGGLGHHREHRSWRGRLDRRREWLAALLTSNRWRAPRSCTRASSPACRSPRFAPCRIVWNEEPGCVGSGRGGEQLGRVSLRLLESVMTLSLGFSPCPNDCFMFDAIVNQRIDLEGLSFTPHLADVEALNRETFSGAADVTKLSYHAYALLPSRLRAARLPAALSAGTAARC